MELNIGYIFLSVCWCIVLCRSGSVNVTSQSLELTVDQEFPTPGTNVTLSCRQANETEISVVWDVNNRTVLTTSGDSDNCNISFSDPKADNLASDCWLEDDTLRLRLLSWQPQPHEMSQKPGDRWRCSQSPAHSQIKVIYSRKPATSLEIRQKILKNGTRAGTVVTCVSSPCRPPIRVRWFIQGEGEKPRVVALEENVKIKQNFVKNLYVTTSHVLFREDEDHGKTVFCRADDKDDSQDAEDDDGGHGVAAAEAKVKDEPAKVKGDHGTDASQVSDDKQAVMSDKIKLKIKYAPKVVSVTIKPHTSVLDGSTVTLVCEVTGRSKPNTTWLDPKGEEISNKKEVTLESVTISDSGKYHCLAENEIPPKAKDSVRLSVRERRVDVHEIHFEDDKFETTGGSGSGLADDTGAMFGGLFAALILVFILGLVLFAFIRHKKFTCKNRDLVEQVEAQASEESESTQTGDQDFYTNLSFQHDDQDLAVARLPGRRISFLNNPTYGINFYSTRPHRGSLPVPLDSPYLAGDITALDDHYRRLGIKILKKPKKLSNLRRSSEGSLFADVRRLRQTSDYDPRRRRTSFDVEFLDY